MSEPTPKTTRRDFIATGAIAAAAFSIVPRHVLGKGFTAPSDLVNVAVVGINGQGGVNCQAMMSQNIVAICDVDDTLLERKLAGWKDSLTPRPDAAGRTGGAGRAGGGGGGRGGGAATPAANAAPVPEWDNYGPSELQKAANAKWQQTPNAERRNGLAEGRLPKLKTSKDDRENVAAKKDIDAVVVATPDHMHAVIASAAMDLGKHVYVQKPMCWSVNEARHLAKKAAEKKVVTQMGNQGHSQDDARRGQDYLAAGAIGDIKEVHVWTNRPLAFWPQGLPRPNKFDGDPATLAWNNSGATRRRGDAFSKAGSDAPKGLDWNLFLGVGADVPYHPLYHPFNWRGWVDWGQGALGDMGAHLIDHPVWGLKLGLPTMIETMSTPFNGVSYPNATMTKYEFAARGSMPPVTLTWYDGGLTPPKPEEMGELKLEGEGGVLYIGTKGKMLQNTYGARPRLLPADLHNSLGAPAEKMVRVPNQSHEMNFINAIRGTDEISSPFSYAAHLTEIMLLGVASLRAGSKLYYDGANMKVTNNAAANEFLTRQYRAGYSL